MTNKKIGILLIVLGPSLIIISLFLWSISKVILHQMDSENSTQVTYEQIKPTGSNDILGV